MIEELTRRVEKLEKENRRLKVISFVVLLTLSAMLLIGANKGDKEIVTENLKIVDEKGNTRIELSGNGEGAPVITFYDSKEKLKLGIGICEDKPKIIFYDSKEEGRLTIAVSDDEPGIVLCDSEEKIKLVMAVFKDGAPSLELYGPDGEVISSLP